MKKPSLKYGLLAGVILAIIFYAPFIIFKNEVFFLRASAIVGYSTMILSMLFVFFGIRSYRDNELGGIITFGKAFLTGFLITLIASVIFGILTMILYKFIFPNFGNEMVDFCKRTIVESGKSKEIMDAELAEMEANRELYTNIPFNGFLMFSTVLLMGTVVALISSLFLKRKASKT